MFSPIQVVGLEIVSFIELVPTIISYLRAFFFVPRWFIGV